MAWCRSVAYPLLHQVRDRVAGRPRVCSSLAARAVAGRPAELVTVEADRAAGTATVMISGELDLTITPPLQEQLAQVLGSNTRQLVFDMDRVVFIDCASARLIVGSGRSLPEGQRPVIRRPSPPVRRILELTGLDAHCQLER